MRTGRESAQENLSLGLIRYMDTVGVVEAYESN